MMNINLMVDQVPSTRTYPCSHICRNGTTLTWSYRMLFYWYHQRGKVMRACYPGPVGDDNLVSPVKFFMRSPFGTVCLATTVASVTG